jgi:hypothetical protein
MTFANSQTAGAVDARSRRRPPYRPVWAFLVLGITAGGLAVAILEAFPNMMTAAGDALLLLDRQGENGEAGFFGRIPSSTYIEMMLSLLALILLYSFLQLYKDKPERLLCRSHWPPKAFLRNGQARASWNGQGAPGAPSEIRNASACGSDAVFSLVVSDAGISRHGDRFVQRHPPLANRHG